MQLLASWFACTLICFPFSYFFRLLLLDRDLLLNKIGLTVARTVLAHSPTAENDFSK